MTTIKNLILKFDYLSKQKNYYFILKIKSYIESFKKIGRFLLKRDERSNPSPRRVAYVPLKSSFIPFLLSLSIHVNVLSFVDYL